MREAETYSFGEWLKQRRERARLTQKELAAAVHCSAAMIKKIEADERRPSPELAGLLAQWLKIPETEQAQFVQVARGERAVDALWHIQESADTPAIPWHVPVPLPRPATPFVGREAELQETGARLAQPDCRLLTLTGPGGVGKTRLALATAHSQQSVFPDGAVFVSLATLTRADSIPEAAARSLNLSLGGPPEQEVLTFLRRRSLLLVLDNCEQLEGMLTWLSELLAFAPGVKILATSRDRLHLAEEWVYVVPELAQAEALFVETARRIKQDFQAETERPDILRICRLVENLPLAVELAASWTPVMPCAQIADHIQRDLNILTAEVHNVPERHRSIQAVFDHSWNLLAQREQDALARLSVFRGGWQAEEARQVAGADLLLLRRLVDQSLVRRLVDQSLVRVGESVRYDLHELIRQYASQKLEQAGAEAEARQRHFEAYRALAAELDAQQFSAQAMAAVTRFDQEQDNLRAALAWGLDQQQIEAMLDLLNHLWFYWSRRGYFHEGGEWALRAVEQAGALDSVDLCSAMSSASAMLTIQGRFGEGEMLGHRAIAMARRLGTPEALIAALGTYTFASIHAEQALAGLQEGITLIEETGKMQVNLPLFYLGSATWLHSSGQYAMAQEYFHKSIALFRQMGVVDFTADPLARLGQLALQEGRLQDAYDLTLESISAAQTGGYAMVFSAWGAARLGLIQLYLGQADAAQQSLKNALQFFEDAPHYERPQQEALALLSEVALAQGDVQAAADYLQASLDICEMFYRQLQVTQKLSGTIDALPVDLMSLCARASLVAAAQGDAARSVTLCSLADALRSQSGQLMIPALQARLDESMAALRSQLSGERFNTAWKNGQGMSTAEVFEFLLARHPGKSAA